MRKQPLGLILLSIILFANITFAQWTTSGSDIYNTNSGNVGIGTDAPIGKFVLSAETAYDNLQFDLVAGGAAGDAVIRFGGNDGGVANYVASDVPWGLGVRRGSNVFTLAYNAAGAANLETGQFMSILSSGNVGIGTTTPATKLHVSGGDLRVTATDANGADIRAIGQDNKGVDLFAQNGKGHIKTDTDGMDLILGAGNWGWNGTSYDQQLVLKSGGRVGIGTATPQAILDVAGTTRTKVIQITGGADIAEPFNITGDSCIEPGMVVSIDPDQIGQLLISENAYDRTVAGIISGAGGVNPGIIMAQSGTEADGEYPVALTGRVYAWADASSGSIEPGDLLTTSDTPGHAMKVSDYSRGRGAIIGKAMSRLEEGKGLVLVLISLQ